jgi:hypothetical protein
MLIDYGNSLYIINYLMSKRSFEAVENKSENEEQYTDPIKGRLIFRSQFEAWLDEEIDKLIIKISNREHLSSMTEDAIKHLKKLIRPQHTKYNKNIDKIENNLSETKNVISSSENETINNNNSLKKPKLERQNACGSLDEKVSPKSFSSFYQNAQNWSFPTPSQSPTTFCPKCGETSNHTTLYPSPCWKCGEISTKLHHPPTNPISFSNTSSLHPFSRSVFSLEDFMKSKQASTISNPISKQTSTLPDFSFFGKSDNIPITPKIYWGYQNNIGPTPLSSLSSSSSTESN